MVKCLTEIQSEELRELAARLTLKGLTTEQIVKTADSLLNAGLYDDALVATIDASPSILSNVEPPFRHFLENVSIQPPEYETSIWHLLYFHMRRIAQTLGDPLLPLNDLVNDVYYDYRFHEKRGNYLGESHGIHHLIGDYWLNDDLLDRENEIVYNGKTGAEILNEVRESTRRSASEWLDCHANRIRTEAGWP